jgi:hypothetical protein
MKREVGSYGEDNGETARFEGDDVGLPESPIYSNFSKNLWRAHTARAGAIAQQVARRHERPQADAGRIVASVRHSLLSAARYYGDRHDHKTRG